MSIWGELWLITFLVVGSAVGAALAAGGSARQLAGWDNVWGRRPVSLLRPPSSRAKLERVLADLDLPADWTADDLVRAAEQQRGRPIIRASLPESCPAGLCGLWLQRPHDDIVLVRPSPDALLGKHFLAHEIAHMLLGHGQEGTPEELAELLAGPGRAPEESVASNAPGACFASTEEYLAELLATMMFGLRRQASSGAVPGRR